MDKTFIEGEVLHASELNELVAEINGKQDTISDLGTIRSGAQLGATAIQTETDPTVPAWAKEATKPTYTAAEVGAAAASHTHAQTDITGLADALAGKAASVHTHAQSDVTGLESALAGKSDTGHTHTMGQVADLQTTLAGKSDTGHTHAYDTLTGLPTIPTSTSQLTNDSNLIDGINGILHVWQGTEAEYTALTTKSNDTLYLIK